MYGLIYEPLAAEKNSYAIGELPATLCPTELNDIPEQSNIPPKLTFHPTSTTLRRTSLAIFTVNDLHSFLSMEVSLFCSYSFCKNIVYVLIHGSGFLQTNQTSFDFNGESNLDLQYGMALVGPKQDITLYQTGDDVEGASFNDLLDALDSDYCGGDDPSQDATYPDPLGGYQGPKACGTVKPAYVISTSYAYNEADLTPAYTARQCNEYAKLGMMGTTVLYSSGDFGVAGNGGLCLNPDGSQTKNGTHFNPSFPGTCPFITSVGATQGDSTL